MDVTIERVALEQLLSRTAPAANKYPVRLTAKDGKLTVQATDLDVTIEATAPATVSEAGTVVVSRAGLNDRVRKLGAETVTLTGRDGRLSLRSGKARFGLTLPDASTYPNVEFPTSTATTVDADELVGALRRVLIAVSTDASRAALTGVLFDAGSDELSLVATDSYRLAVNNLPGDGFLAGSALVPSGALTALVGAMGSGKIEVRADDRRVAFTTTDVTVMGRLLADAFPDYQRLVPTDPDTQFTTSASELVACIRRAEVVLGSTGTAVRMALGTDGLTATAATGPDDFSEVVSGTLVGPPVAFAVNPVYLRAGVLACPGGTVTIGASEPMRPLLVTGTSPGFRYVIMPVRA